MKDSMENLFHLADVPQALANLRAWVRTERQRLGWTQADLARRSGVAATTISRFERTGLGSTDVWLRLLFALDRIDAADAFFRERLRLAKIPVSLESYDENRVVCRVRRRRSMP